MKIEGSESKITPTKENEVSKLAAYPVKRFVTGAIREMYPKYIMQTGKVAMVAERLCERENIMPFMILPGCIIFETKEVKVSTKIGQINKRPKVESRESNKEILPNPKGLKYSNITVAAPREFSESGFLKIKFPITSIT